MHSKFKRPIELFSFSNLSVALGSTCVMIASIWFFAPTTAFAAAPTVSTFSPADGATNVAAISNLVITFSEAVTATTTVTSNITIKKSSDDSTVETINASSSQITGSGSTVIVINPSVTLSSGTSYYVQIASTAFFNGTNEYYAGISNTTTWNFTVASGGSGGGGDVAPLEPGLSVQLDGDDAIVRGSYPTTVVEVDEIGFSYEFDDEEEKVEIENAPSSFSYKVRKLACGTEYVFVGYAKNDVDTTESDEVTITTEDCDDDASDDDSDDSEEETITEAVTETDTASTGEEKTNNLISNFTTFVLQQAPTDLSQGSSGMSVAYLQAFLMLQNTGPAAQALQKERITGYFGDATQAALAEYQAAHGIFPSSGYWGPLTRSFLGNMGR